ncbi:response regulator [Zavarzinella formosa]|uniref:response regulator n=1 Tax=Zavarzinella formosa TaxID=360055 RepID=UPI000360C3A0|nr:response regulator [Zavarzinella formosa]
MDDNHDVSDTNALILSLNGFVAEACYDGITALRLARQPPPDLCFIDLNMPGMDGDELAIRLRELAPRRLMTLVAVTAMSREGDVRRLARAGFAIHLIKPADPTMLVNIAKGMHD